MLPYLCMFVTLCKLYNLGMFVTLLPYLCVLSYIFIYFLPFLCKLHVPYLHVCMLAYQCMFVTLYK